jgi:hypothetical protein
MQRPSPRVRWRSFVRHALLLPLALAGCSHDVVLPDVEARSTCGDGVTEANEQCDVTSPGCIQCVVQPEWTCTATGCSPLCVDGVIGNGPTCEDAHRDSACDLTGFWAVRETTYLRDMILSSVQVSSNWYLYGIGQTGDHFSIDASLDCGVHVSGLATIDFPPKTARALIWLNSEDGTDPARGKRTGTSTATPEGCAITLAPWYFLRGVTTAYFPESFASDVALDTLEPLPSVADPVNGNVFPAGATDPTTLGIPGAGFVISGFVPGLRYSAQRSTTSFATTHSITAGALQIVLPGAFNVQENVLRVTECGGACPLLTALAYPATDLPPHTTLSFIGKTIGSARVAPIVVSQPRADVDLDLETCANIQQLLPHDGTVPQ